MHFLDQLRERGLVHDLSDEAGIRKLGPGTVFYHGIDPTAACLQLGNLVPLAIILRLGLCGLSPILLFGGATGAIGDPGGKSAERPLLERETIVGNIERQRRKTVEIFARKSVKAAFVDNYDWTKDVVVLDFLRDIGKHFTVNYMMQKESVRTRIEGDGISFTEFSYMLLQAFDFLYLYQKMGCKMQMGGSDQWGNITAGLELIRRKIQGEAYAISNPLITNKQGKKLGKSEGGAIWLDTEKTSSYKLHQYLLNTEDSEVEKLLHIFSFAEMDVLRELSESLRARPEKREAQTFLADEVCSLVHGEEATKDAKRCAEVLFGGSIKGLSDKQLEDIFSDVPSSTMARDKLRALSACDIFVTAGLAASKGEARRLITQGGAYINNERIGDPTPLIEGTAFADATLLVLRSGKKNYHLLKVC